MKTTLIIIGVGLLTISIVLLIKGIKTDNYFYSSLGGWIGAAGGCLLAYTIL